MIYEINAVGVFYSYMPTLASIFILYSDVLYEYFYNVVFRALITFVGLWCNFCHCFYYF